MAVRPEVTGSSSEFARFKIAEIQAIRSEARKFREGMSDLAGYARKVVEKGTWSGGDYVGTQFLPVQEGKMIAIREVPPSAASDDRQASGDRISLIIQDVGSEPEEIASIEGNFIEINGVGPADAHMLGSIWSLIDYINAHEAK